MYKSTFYKPLRYIFAQFEVFLCSSHIDIFVGPLFSRKCDLFISNLQSSGILVFDVVIKLSGLPFNVRIPCPSIVGTHFVIYI